jgi:hypothetical protein
MFVWLMNELRPALQLEVQKGPHAGAYGWLAVLELG